ncbi:MAG: PGF-pre-PGF domain-containing protein [Candidatus Bathyarchaeota archaeon]|nr:PGF-pre-PGF domain-containing protein [Candidatus Bathyarchaeota archaeon]
MPKSRSLFKSSSYRRKLFEIFEKKTRNSWRIARNKMYIFVVFSILVSICKPVCADYFPPTPSQHIVVKETCVSVSTTTPTHTIFINVTEYDTEQIVKNITIEFCEPVTYVSFSLKVLSKRPSYVGSLNNSTLLQYYAIAFSTEATDEAANVTMDFAIEKNAKQKKAADETTLVLYRCDRGKTEECPTEKLAEDDVFLYFRTTTVGFSYVAVVGGVTSMLPWFALVVFAAAALITVTGIYAYRRFKRVSLRKILRTLYGK